jgi:site-specific DNA-methyltransferase (adenine-specific)
MELAPIPDHLLNKVVLGDCLEVMKELPDGCIDLVLCDLPYGTTQNPWDSLIDFQLLWQHYERVVKANGVVILTGHGRFTASLILSKPDWFRFKLVWIKSKAPNFLQANNQPLKKHEDICVFCRGQPRYHPQMMSGKPYNRGKRKDSATGSYGQYRPNNGINTGYRYPYDIAFFEEDIPDWIYYKTAETEGKTFHPSQKPVDLGRYLIRTFSIPGAVVLDNACGSGSFLVAAVLEDRRFIGIEKNEGAFSLKTTSADFIAVSRQRINEAIKQFKLNKEKP